MALVININDFSLQCYAIDILKTLKILFLIKTKTKLRYDKFVVGSKLNRNTMHDSRIH